MATIIKYISNVELETQIKKIMNNEYGLFDECTSCGGLRILHREGVCLWKKQEDKEEIEKEKILLIV